MQTKTQDIKASQFDTNTFLVLNEDNDTIDAHIHRIELGGGDWGYYVKSGSTVWSGETLSKCLDSKREALDWISENL